jgi:hypothetical protein
MLHKYHWARTLLYKQGNLGPVLSMRVPVRDKTLYAAGVRTPDLTRLVTIITPSSSLRRLCASSFTVKAAEHRHRDS